MFMERDTSGFYRGLLKDRWMLAIIGGAVVCFLLAIMGCRKAADPIGNVALNKEMAKAESPFVATGESLRKPQSASTRERELALEPLTPLTQGGKTDSSESQTPDASLGKAKSALKSLTSGGSTAVIDTAAKVFNTAGVVLSESASPFTANHLSRMYVSGMFLIGLAFAARLIFGSWKDAFLTTGLGLAPAVIGVMLTEYSRSVLIVPVGIIAVGGAYLWRIIRRWRSEAKAFETTAKAIETLDNKTVKKAVAKADSKGAVAKALKETGIGGK